MSVGVFVLHGKSIEVAGLSSRRVKFLLRRFLYVNHLSGYGVLDTSGSFEIVHIMPETREEEGEREPLKPAMSPPPVYHPVTPSDMIGWQRGAGTLSPHTKLPWKPSLVLRRDFMLL